MLDWFWEFLYGISKALFQVIDAMIYSAKKLCGIEDIYIDGEATDFLTYLIRSSRIQYAFSVVAIAASVLCVLLAVIEIVRTVLKEKNESPAKIALKAGKNIFVFLFVPALMFATMSLMNAFGQVLYSATSGSESSTLGGFLFTAFSESGDAWKVGYTEDFISTAGGEVAKNYMSMADVNGAINLGDFNFIMSWVTSIVLMIPIGMMLLMFVDRAISIVILYLAAPFSIAASIVDDGARFKLWRDQVLVKFITGYGAIISLNIYAVCSTMIMSNSVVFFPETGTQLLPFFSNNFLNFLVKLVFLIGGAFSMQKVMALVGNLVSQGAGSNEMRDTAIASAGLGGMLRRAGRTAFGLGKSVAGKTLGGIGKATGISDVASRIKDDVSNRFNGFGKGMADKILGMSDKGKALKERTDKMRDDAKPLTKGTLMDVLNNFRSGNGNNNANNNQNPENKRGQDMIQNAIANDRAEQNARNEQIEQE